MDERFLFFSYLLAQVYGVNQPTVAKLSGDVSDLVSVNNNTVIFATPAHWDALSRRWRQRKAIQNVSLIVVEELHLLGGSDGPVLEIVLSRSRYIASQLVLPFYFKL